MNSAAFEFIKSDIIALRSDIKEMRKDIKDLLAFKWRATGIILFLTLVCQLVIKYVFI